MGDNKMVDFAAGLFIARAAPGAIWDIIKAVFFIWLIAVTVKACKDADTEYEKLHGKPAAVSAAKLAAPVGAPRPLAPKAPAPSCMPPANFVVMPVPCK